MNKTNERNKPAFSNYHKESRYSSKNTKKVNFTSSFLDEFGEELYPSTLKKDVQSKKNERGLT